MPYQLKFSPEEEEIRFLVYRKEMVDPLVRLLTELYTFNFRNSESTIVFFFKNEN